MLWANIVLAASMLESADDITAAATAPSPIIPTQLGVRYCKTSGRIRVLSGGGNV